MGQRQIAAIGSLLANDTRASVLTALMDGRAHTGGELARHVGVSASTVSEHLSKLLDARMVTVQAHGRHSYFRLAGAEVAELLETVGAASTPALGPQRRVPAELAYARSCYDHLAGELAVRIYDQLCGHGHLHEDDDHPRLTPSGFELLGRIGVEPDSLRQNKRPAARTCLDWSERRNHLAGGAGAALLTAFFANRWIVWGRRPRSLHVTAAGKAAIVQHFAIAAGSRTR